MNEDYKEAINRQAWHAEDGYSESECRRLIQACNFIRAAADAAAAPETRFKLLDVGCGIGPLRRWLPREGFHITGLDISAGAAETAKKNYDDCLVCDIERPWPVPDGDFDGIHAGALLEHVLDWHAPLNQANVALKENGLLVVSVPNLRSWSEVKRLIKGRQPHWIADVKHLHGYTPAFLKELLLLHGFEVQNMIADRVTLPLLPSRNDWVCRKFAAWGSVIVVAARLVSRTRVEDAARAAEFPQCEEVGCRSIRIIE